MLIRAERVDDVDGITRVVATAFARADQDSVPEVDLVESLRSSDAWIPHLSLVAEIEDQVVAHCVSSRAHVGNSPVLALGPIGVLPDRQGTGIGTALMRTTIDIASDMNEPLIGLLGDPGYYGRFGFVASSSFGIEPPDVAWGEHFQVLPIGSGELPAGRFRYAAPFEVVS